MRDSVLFYRTHINALRALPAEQAKEAFLAIADYALDGTEPEEQGIGYVMLQMVKPIIDKNNKKAENRIRNKQEQTGTKENEPKQIEHIKGKGEKVKGKEKECIGRFTPPSAEQVREYSRESGHDIDVDKFIDFYECKGWMVGKNKMKDWKAAVRNWSRSDSQRQGVAAKGNKFNNFKGRDIDYDDLERRLLGG